MKGILIGLGAASIALTLYFLRWPLFPIELALYDLNFRSFRSETRPPSEIVIVAIDSPSLESLGSFPWPRRHHAAVIERVARSGAKAIGVDIGIFEPDGTDPRNDERLIRATREAGNVVYPMFVEETEEAGRRRVRMHRPMPELAAVSAGEGHGHLMFGPDEVVRSVGLACRMEDEIFWRMDFEVFRVSQGLPASAITVRPGVVSLGPLEVPVNVPRRVEEGEQTPVFEHELDIVFAGPTGTFERISARDVIEGRFPPDAFRDRIVLYGGTASELGDGFSTPSSAAQAPMHGVEVQANVVHALLKRQFLRRVGASITSLLTVFASAAVSLYVRAQGPLGVTVALLLFVAAAYVLAFNAFGYWIEVAPILVAVVLSFAASAFRWRRISDRIPAC